MRVPQAILITSPATFGAASLMVSNLAISLASRAAKAITQEFLGKRLTRHVPAGD
jgi:hypothetical protein